MMNFARTHLGLLKFVAKIKADNDGSINMFKKLGYKETCFVECFNEYCFEFAFDGAAATTQSTAGAQAGVEGVVSPASVKEEAKEADMPILIGDVSLALSTLHLGPSSFSASSATLVSAGSLTRKDAEVILAHLLDRKAATQKEMLANLELNATRQTNDKVKAVLLKKLDVQRANIVWELAKEKERIMSDDRIRTLLT